ncbi:YihY/virulence factor BrkB family protein [Rhodoligotrophos defluvii]|uniref:YihY/virulence factor BrkB family protein n=1 Tax=Rhodoligotrophos defluvii TaxID=2561934 RepID=UPI0010C99E3E|nr:YihY/virulence factor BrkB family protein [Rhodoligotrophos defluvii]
MWQKVRKLARETIAGWWSDRAMSLGAAIAFYAVFSLAPTLLMVIAIAGLAFGREAAREAIADELGGLIGEDGASLVLTMMADAGEFEAGLIGTAVGLVTFLLVATGVFVEIQDALNIVWKAKPIAATGGVWAFVRGRLLSFALIASIGFLLLVSLLVDAALSAASGYVLGAFPGATTLLFAVNFVLGFLFAVLLFGLIFAILPNTEPTAAEVIPGAILSGVLFTFGKFAIGIIVGQSGVTSAYGASASIMTIMLWVYYSSQILLLGAEFGRAYGRNAGSSK